ncbi:MAG: hypothetical protein RL217_931 [Pseudomonadota bacterium]
MIPAWQLIVIFLLYVASLFLVAWFGDKRAQEQRPVHNNGWVYALSLGVYCTSWTFYGAVGQAASSGWLFLAIYVGPILFFLFFWRLLHKIIRIAKEKRLTSIADFIGTRYGKDHSLAIVITLVALVSIIPYVALQLKAIATTFELISTTYHGENLTTEFWQDTAFYISAAMAIFVIIFGTRDIDASEQHPGMMLAIAFESLIKLSALLILGFWVVSTLYSSPADILEIAQAQLPQHALLDGPLISLAFVLQTLLAGLSLLCLPRQFQVAVIENDQAKHIHTARWVFPLYLILMVIFVAPIALSGQLFLQDLNLPPDTYVISLPLHLEQNTLSIVAFIGGASAATSMIIVATIAISTMVSNELVLPILFRKNLTELAQSQTIRSWILGVRRAVILAIMLCAYGFYRSISSIDSLAILGLLSFALAAQFAPALILGLFWHKANKQGATAGILGGALAWFLLLLWPFLTENNAPSSLQGTEILGLSVDEFSLGVLTSLWVNLSLLVFFSLSSTSSVRERMIASDFIRNKKAPASTPQSLAVQCSVEDVRLVLERILGKEKTSKFFQDFMQRFGTVQDKNIADLNLLKHSEKLLASVVGSSSAQILFSTFLGGESLHIQDLVSVASDASHAFDLNREQLQAALENLQQGVSVIDKNLNLVAWNQRYIELLNYPSRFLYVGQSVAEIIEFNANRGFCGEGDIAAMIAKRLLHLKHQSAHQFERTLPSGVVILMQGHPLPDDGYITSFTDISMHKKAEQALKAANVSLEQRVEASSQELSYLTERLIEANASKTRFLAASGHDLMQPLNAAKLFASTLSQQNLTAEQQQLLHYLEGSLQSAEDVLSTLVEISKLDADAIAPVIQPLFLPSVLKPLKDEFTALAAQKNLRLRTRYGEDWVLGDAHWLRRIIQNLLANAVHYSERGDILLACRRRGAFLYVEVWDSGVGIPKDKLKDIFQEFKRLDNKNKNTKGLGLGLAIVERMTKRLGYRIEPCSIQGKGSRFRLILPLTQAQEHSSTPTLLASSSSGFNGLKTLIMDNDANVLRAMNTLLQSWQCQTHTCRNLAQALHAPFQAQLVLADYQLDNDENGLDALIALQKEWGNTMAGILISATPSARIEEKAKELGFYFLRKPIKPAALRALLRRISRT